MRLSQPQQAILQKAVMPCDPEIFIKYIQASGFNGEDYLDTNPDLARNKLDSSAAFFHFLHWGYRENRNIPVGKPSEGIRDLLSLPINNREYLLDITRALFSRQLRKSENHSMFWDEIKQEHIDLVRETDGHPYLIVGDSHANLYCPLSTKDSGYIAPFLLLCSGGSARGLANARSKSQYGSRLLNWATANAILLRKNPNIPIFLKFGQVDVEFVWILRRTKLGVVNFSESEFDDFVADVVQSYGAFLLAFRQHIDSSMMRICSIFPPTLSDTSWAKGYMNAHIGFLESDQAHDELSQEVQKLEIPNIVTRTKLHARFNAQLKAFCSASDLIFVDDFNPLLGSNDTVDARFFVHGGSDHHLSPGGLTSETITSIIRNELQRTIPINIGPQ